MAYGSWVACGGCLSGCERVNWRRTGIRIGVSSYEAAHLFDWGVGGVFLRSVRVLDGPLVEVLMGGGSGVCVLF